MAIFNFNNIHTLKRLNNSLFRFIGNETRGRNNKTKKGASANAE